MKNYLLGFLSAMLALFAMPAMASNHTGIDPIEHFWMHVDQAKFWIGQGEWAMAFNQPICASELTWQTTLTHFVFVEGGGLVVVTGVSFLMVWVMRRHILRALHTNTWFRRFNRTSYA